jgi:hypothetical protein
MQNGQCRMSGRTLAADYSPFSIVHSPLFLGRRRWSRT